MKLTTKRSWQVTLIAGSLLIGGLLAPRAAHAVAAALVQVTNTISNPAITHETDKAASQLVQLTGVSGSYLFSSGTLPMGQFDPGTSTTGGSPYVVPAGQTLVITDIDLNISGTSGDTGVLFYNYKITPANFGQFYQRYDFFTNGPQHLHYDSGLVFPAGDEVGINVVFSNAGELGVTMRGYLTYN